MEFHEPSHEVTEKGWKKRDTGVQLFLCWGILTRESRGMLPTSVGRVDRLPKVAKVMVEGPYQVKQRGTYYIFTLFMMWGCVVYRSLVSPSKVSIVVFDSNLLQISFSWSLVSLSRSYTVCQEATGSAWSKSLKEVNIAGGFLVDQMWMLKDVCFWYVTYFSIDIYKGRIQTQIRQEHKPSLHQLSQELVSTVYTVECSAYFGLSSETKCEKSVWVFSLVLSNQASIWKASWTNEPTYRYGLLLEAIGSLRMI